MVLPEASGATSALPAYKPAGADGDFSRTSRSGGVSPTAKTEKRMDDEQNTGGMYVLNRRGERESVSFDQILHRVQSLCYGLHPLVDAARVSQAVINGMFAGIKTSQLDELAAQTSGRPRQQTVACFRFTTVLGGLPVNRFLALGPRIVQPSFLYLHSSIHGGDPPGLLEARCSYCH